VGAAEGGERRRHGYPFWRGREACASMEHYCAEKTAHWPLLGLGPVTLKINNQHTLRLKNGLRRPARHFPRHSQVDINSA